MSQRAIFFLYLLQELKDVEMMVFQELPEAGPAVMMQPAPATPHRDALGLLPEPMVMLHSLSSSE